MSVQAERNVALFGAERLIGAALQGVLQRRGISICCHQERDGCLQSLSQEPISVLIVDFNGHVHCALDLLHEARRLFPSVSGLGLVDRGDISTAVRAMKAGATDCLEKPIEPERLFSALKEGFSDKQERMSPSNRVLTKTEAEVLNLILTGRTTNAVAAVMHRSKRTIEIHRRHIARKLQASGMVDLVRRASMLGLIDLESWGRIPSESGPGFSGHA